MSDAHASGVRHYYVAVGYHDAKIGTLFELLRALQAQAPAGIVICCNARDSLDDVCSTALGYSDYKVLALHADLSEQQVDSIVDYFKKKCILAYAGYDTSITTNLPSTSHNNNNNPPSNPASLNNTDTNTATATTISTTERASTSSARGADNIATTNNETPKMLLLATTDAPLKNINKELLPLGPLLLINYDLPTRKDNYMRRMSTILGSRTSAQRPRITVNFVEAGKLDELRAYEALAERPVEEMPVHAMDIIAPVKTTTSAGQ